MNWKLKLVLGYVNIRKPLEAASAEELVKHRGKAEIASWLGTKIFDKHVDVKNVTNTTADGVPVRIYQSSDAKGQRVIVYYHGGGFALYGLNSHDNVCRRLCKMNNCVVVSVDYRLAPEHPYPAAHNDTFTALQWVIKNIAQYGGDANNIVVAGDSAGGNLSACMAHRCKQQGIALKAQILIYPWIDGKLNNPSIDRNGEGYLLTKPTMFLFQKMYTPDPKDRLLPTISPCYEPDFTNLAPAFILTGQYDPLLDDGYKYAQQLKAAGNKVEYKEYPALVHGFFNIPLVDKHAMQAYYDIAEFLKKV